MRVFTVASGMPSTSGDFGHRLILVINKIEDRAVIRRQLGDAGLDLGALVLLLAATSGVSSSASRSRPASSAMPSTSVRLRSTLMALLWAIDSIQVIGSDRPS